MELEESKRRENSAYAKKQIVDLKKANSHSCILLAKGKSLSIINMFRFGGVGKFRNRKREKRGRGGETTELTCHIDVHLGRSLYPRSHHSRLKHLLLGVEPSEPQHIPACSRLNIEIEGRKKEKRIAREPQKEEERRECEQALFCIAAKNRRAGELRGRREKALTKYRN